MGKVNRKREVLNKSCLKRSISSGRIVQNVHVRLSPLPSAHLHHLAEMITEAPPKKTDGADGKGRGGVTRCASGVRSRAGQRALSSEAQDTQSIHTAPVFTEGAVIMSCNHDFRKRLVRAL